jgi:hypothetical protein
MTNCPDDFASHLKQYEAGRLGKTELPLKVGWFEKDIHELISTQIVCK